MRVPFVLLLLLRSCCTASRLLGTDPGFCNSLTSTSVQMKGQMLAAVTVSTREGCCAACEKQPGCQMWWLKDASKGFACELYGLDKGPVTWSIMYRTHAGLMTTGPSALVQQSPECEEDVWLFKGVAFDGVVKASAADPYAAAAGAAFTNGFKAPTWQDCCKGARQAPGTTVMERAYQYRGRQYWTWSQAEGRCYVTVRPFQVGATVLTMRPAPGTVSGMFGNEP